MVAFCFYVCHYLLLCLITCFISVYVWATCVYHCGCCSNRICDFPRVLLCFLFFIRCVSLMVRPFKKIVCFESTRSFLFQCQNEIHTQDIYLRNVTFQLTMKWTHFCRLVTHEKFSILKEKLCEIWKLMHFFHTMPVYVFLPRSLLREKILTQNSQFISNGLPHFHITLSQKTYT